MSQAVSIFILPMVRKLQAQQAEVDRSLQVVDCSDAEGGMLPPDDIFAKIKALVDSRL